MPTPSLLIVPARFKTGRLYSQIPTSGAGDFTVTRNTTATRLNSAGVIESVASGIPRLDYLTSGGVTGCPALLVEPAATNSIRNNSNTGAVTGTPGTLPNNWADNNLGGLTRQIVAIGTESGVSYIDIRLSGTATSAQASIGFETTTGITASTGQAWTSSVWLRRISQPNPPVSYNLFMYERTSLGVFVAGGGSVVSVTSELSRVSFTRTLSGGGTVARVQPTIDFVLTIGQTYDFTVRIGYPQMELGSVATSVIPTTAGTGSRSEDVISVTGAVSGSIGQTAGTLYIEFVQNNNVSLNRIIAIDNGTNSDNGFDIVTTAAGNIRITYRVLGVAQCDITTSVVTAVGVAYKVAFAYSQNDFVIYVNGIERGTDSSGNTTLTPSRIILGGRSDATGNVRARAAALYTTRLTNAELALLTA